jgi:hypothetical protein
MPDPQRIEAILNYPAPKNRKQLRRFLGVCGFISGSSLVTQAMLRNSLYYCKRRTNWDGLQSFNQLLRHYALKFAHSIHLIHPDDNLPYTIHTDASGMAEAAVLMQIKEGGDTRSVNCIASTNAGRTTVFYL